MRGKRPTLTAFAGVVLVLAQLAGCGSCVKDDPIPSSTDPNYKGRKPINLKAADKKLSQFTQPEGGDADPSTE